MSEANSALRRWIDGLQSPDPGERERCINELQLLGDTAALPALASVFATDPEPALRTLAQQAGKAIYYGAIRQQLEQDEASAEERRQAAEILARARAKKHANRRRR